MHISVLKRRFWKIDLQNPQSFLVSGRILTCGQRVGRPKPYEESRVCAFPLIVSGCDEMSTAPSNLGYTSSYYRRLLAQKFLLFR